MIYNPDIHHRRSIRLDGYDYSHAGAYFISIAAQGRLCLFGSVVDGELRLNDAGKMVRRVWDGMPDRFPFINMDEFVVMPNHVHGVIFIRQPVPTTGAPTMGAPALGDVVGAFKSVTTVEYLGVCGVWAGSVSISGCGSGTILNALSGTNTSSVEPGSTSPITS